MPWPEVSLMALREEFVGLAQQEGASVRELCRRFGISSKTGYKWLARAATDGAAPLADRSRRPHASPRRTASLLEAAVLRVRDAHPAWGGRKVRAWLRQQGHERVPSASTITAILQRHDRVDPAAAAQRQPWQRFEQPMPNALWQMDFKGHFALDQGRCHPLTVLDDHSRFALGLEACADERGVTVRERLRSIFRRYGLPARMLMDNGSPWGDDAAHPHTPLTVWLLRMGVAVSHGRPYHPQTQGKDERFHRTLRVELLQGRAFPDLVSCQHAFDGWRDTYNRERPHEALGLATPASRYRMSPRPFPETLPPMEYDAADVVRKVLDQGFISFRGQRFRIGKPFVGYPVALRPTPIDGVWSVWFMTHEIARIDLHGSTSHD